jgi:16S rRNA (guanine527-N7)-methyltransferase
LELLRSLPIPFAAIATLPETSIGMNPRSQTERLRATLETEAASYNVTLSEETLNALSKYYDLLNAWNSRLHLVAPTSPREFATRHVMESLLLLEHLPEGATVADIGSGAGLPILPCLMARPDLQAFLIEASKKKSVFLREALNHTSTAKQACVIAERFQDIGAPGVGFVSSRALERFEKMLPQLLKWAPPRSKLLLFAGKGLGEIIEKSGFDVMTVVIPNSKRRFLFVVTKV